jgi:hypothetical protein
MRRIDRSTLDAVIGPLSVTFDLFVLLARKHGARQGR